MIKTGISGTMKTYWLVQFSVQSDGLLGELGPAKVSPQFIPLHELICRLQDSTCQRLRIKPSSWFESTIEYDDITCQTIEQTSRVPVKA